MNDLRIFSLCEIPKEFAHSLNSMGYDPVPVPSPGEADALMHLVPPGDEQDLLGFLDMVGRCKPEIVFLQLDRSEFARALDALVDLGFRCAWIRLSGSQYAFAAWMSA